MIRFKAFLRDHAGATSIEYALIAGLIALVIIASLTAVGTRLSVKFNSIAQNLT